MTAIRSDSHPRLGPQVQLLNRPNATVLVFPDGSLELNPTAHDLLQRCDGRMTVAEIISSLQEDYAATDSDLSGDILACLEVLHRLKLITLAN